MHLSKSNIHETSHSADPEALFVANRSNLKSIFSHHSPQDNKISFSEFCKFCKHTQIFPDLISMLDIKRVVTRVTQYQNSRSSLTYQNFEQSLKYIAIAAYHGLSLTDKLRNLFLQISDSCKEIYNVIITLPKHSRGNTPLSCDTSGSEFEDNRNNNRGHVHSYSQKQFFKKGSVHTNINIALDINSAIASHQSCSPRDSKSTSRIRVSPKKIAPGYSHRAVSQEPSPLQNKNLHNKKKEGYQAISEIKKFSQEFCEKAKNLGSLLSNDKKHYRTLSGGTYVLQSPRFGGGSTLIPVDSERYSNRDLRRSVDLKAAPKEKNIEKLFFKFREEFKKSENLKPKINKEPSLTSLRKHRNYITKVRNHGFTGNMVMRMIFSAWKGLASNKRQIN